MLDMLISHVRQWKGNQLPVTSCAYHLLGLVFPGHTAATMASPQETMRRNGGDAGEMVEKEGGGDLAEHVHVGRRDIMQIALAGSSSLFHTSLSF